MKRGDRQESEDGRDEDETEEDGRDEKTKTKTKTREEEKKRRERERQQRQCTSEKKSVASGTCAAPHEAYRNRENAHDYYLARRGT